MTPRWGFSLPNKLGWMLMEAPVFILMTILWLLSDRIFEPAAFCMFLLFQAHYFQRSFIFPFLLKGKNRMPLSIIAMGVVFNLLNALMQGGWLFYISPAGMYSAEWFATPQFWIGAILFVTGMYLNIDSDRRIRGLRKPGDTRHYFPRGGMYNYVTSANYFGELVDWCGFAIMSWSAAGAVFAWWTFANLVPRANAIYQSYQEEFPQEVKDSGVKRIIPFIY